MGSASSMQSIQDKKSIFNNTQDKPSLLHNISLEKDNISLEKDNISLEKDNMTSETIFFFINNQYDIGESLFYNFNRNFTLPVQS